MIVVSFGGGVNSTAMLCGLWEEGEKPDLILFADTGGEKPHTYAHLHWMRAWLSERKWPTIETVRYKRETLEENCLRAKCLPSIAYGFKKCSQKFKRQPQDQYCNNHDGCIAVWESGKKVTKLIGYDMDEPHRAKIPEDEKYQYRYPLIEWGWGRDECEAAIKRNGLKSPGKSACFFCPSSKKHEIIELRMVYPKLAARAVAMEENAELTQVKGLGRNFAWKDLYEAQDRQMDMFAESHIEIDCGCYDG